MSDRLHDHFTATFYGVRGTLPTPGSTFASYGGNTSCVALRCGERLLILDSGTGIYKLGHEILKKGGAQEIDILLSHLHIDHIQGLPFFMPLYGKQYTVRLWAGNLLPEFRLEAVVDQLMSAPLFPITHKQAAATIEFHDFYAGESIEPPGLSEAGISITTMRLHHPGGATGYRVEYAGKSVCYITDIEHHENGLDKDVLAFIKDADLFIYDCTFDDDNYKKFKGWGHSTWQEAVRLAKEAGVKQLADFHHDPNCNDIDLDIRAKALKALFPAGFVVKEGQVVVV
jgi:phosphoribosyl 1,2-cyclic phosphodiesterase